MCLSHMLTSFGVLSHHAISSRNTYIHKETASHNQDRGSVLFSYVTSEITVTLTIPPN